MLVRQLGWAGLFLARDTDETKWQRKHIDSAIFFESMRRGRTKRRRLPGTSRQALGLSFWWGFAGLVEKGYGGLIDMLRIRARAETGLLRIVDWLKLEI